jgi:hypothetical protein
MVHPPVHVSHKNRGLSELLVAVRGSKIWEVICTRASGNVQMWNHSVYKCKYSGMAHMVCARSSSLPEIVEECSNSAIFFSLLPDWMEGLAGTPRAYHVSADFVDMPYPGRYGSRYNTMTGCR